MKQKHIYVTIEQLKNHYSLYTIENGLFIAHLIFNDVIIYQIDATKLKAIFVGGAKVRKQQIKFKGFIYPINFNWKLINL